MKKELPGIFKKDVDNNHCHNKKVFYANKEETEFQRSPLYTDSNSDFTVEDKIRKLFKSSRYVFNINVIIKTDKKVYNTKIAGKIKNSLITVENEIIPIIEINDIIIKDRI